MTATEPPNTSNLEGAQDKLFRYPVAWDTTTEPNGGNGIHTITVSPLHFQEFAGGQWQEPFEHAAPAVQVDVRNVTIKDVSVSTGTVDYVPRLATASHVGVALLRLLRAA